MFFPPPDPNLCSYWLDKLSQIEIREEYSEYLESTGSPEQADNIRFYIKQIQNCIEADCERY